MISAVLLPNAKACFITSAGAPAVGYLLYTYDAGTLNPRTTYLDAAGLANNTNPIVLDARGEAVIYWDGSYKVILKDPSNVTIWTADNFSQGPLSNPVPWAAAGGAADAITATYSPAITALTDGLLLTFRSTAANATATPTFSPNGLTARTIVKAGGQALVAGNIPRANYEAVVRYNLANTRWELVDPNESITVSAALVLSFGGSSVGITVSQSSGTFTRTGNIVNFTYAFVLTSKGVQVGAAILTGLPFTPTNNGLNPPISIFETVTAGMTMPMATVRANNAIVDLFNFVGNTAAVQTDANFTNTTQLTISGSYQTG